MISQFPGQVMHKHDVALDPALEQCTVLPVNASFSGEGVALLSGNILFLDITFNCPVILVNFCFFLFFSNLGHFILQLSPCNNFKYKKTLKESFYCLQTYEEEITVILDHYFQILMQHLLQEVELQILACSI